MDSTGELHVVQEETDDGAVNIAVQGCCHGELDTIYRKIEQIQSSTGTKVDLLLICGDFECVRDAVDLCCMAVPPKYRHLKNFHKYFNGESIAPVKTIFIGGNHEASNVLQSLYYGGYVAPNIFFLGWASVVNFKGLRIGGLSGIYNDKHFTHGHFERPPYTDNTMRSVYHLRAYEVRQMLHLPSPTSPRPTSDRPVDIFLTHDWPSRVWEYGDVDSLLRIKPYFRADIDKGELGSPPARQILDHLQPSFWFSGHLHVKFPAVIPHPPSLDVEGTATASSPRVTRFLALDKVIPGRGYLQFLQVPSPPTPAKESASVHIPVYHDDELHFDIEWCTILRATHEQMRQTRYLYRDTPASVSPEALAETAELLRREYGDQLVIPMQPVARSAGHSTMIETVCAVCQPPLAATSPHSSSPYHTSTNTQRLQEGNPQTDRFLQALGLRHVWTIPFGTVGAPVQHQQPPPPAYPAPPLQSASAPPVETPSSRPLIPSQLLMQSGSSHHGLHRPPPPPLPFPPAAASASAPVAATDPNELDI